MTHADVILAIVRDTKQHGGTMPRYGWLHRPAWQALRRAMAEDPAVYVLGDEAADLGQPALIVCGVAIYPREAPEPVIEFSGEASA